jgi:hypothetical protein
MDLNRFLQVAWRFKLLLAGGLVLATVVAFLSLARVTLDGNSPSVQFREQETWLSASTLLVTQSGFPWGRAILDDVITVQPKGAEALTIPRYGDPGRYSGLAAIYAQLAKADPVRNSVMAGAGPGSRYEAEVVKSADGSGALPLLYIKGYGPSPEASENVANAATVEFQRYLERQQAKSGIAAGKRVQVVVTQRAGGAEIFEKRSFVRPMMMFLLIVMGFLALAFALENLRPDRDWDDERDPWEHRAARELDRAAVR